MESEGASASHARLRLSRHHRVEMDAFAGYLSDSSANDPEEQDDQPTPKLSSNVALTADTPAARLRALLSRVPNNKPTHSTAVPPSSSARSPQFRSDLVDSDVDALDEYQRPPNTNHSLASSSSLSFARESLRDIFTRARREPGDTPQKNKIPVLRRSSFGELNSAAKKDRRSGKRKSLSDEELEKLPSSLRQPSASGSQTMSIDDLRERLLTESQSQIQDQPPPSLYERSDSMLQDMNISRATPPVATSTPQTFPRKNASSRLDLNLASHLDSHQSQSNLLDADSEMQRVMENVESEEEHGVDYDQVSFPRGAANGTEPPTPPSTSSTPSRSRIPLTRARLDSLDKAYPGITSRRPSGEHRRSVSRTSSITSTHSSMSLCSDEAERIRERERDWNKPKPPIRPSTPELKQGHMHGRFSTRVDSPMVGGNSARRTSITSMHSLEDLSSGSIGSQGEYRERLAELDNERMHERERQWNKRRPRLSYPSPNSSSIPRERTRAVSLTHVPRPDSAMSMSSTTSLQRQQDGPSDPPGEYLHERERNWNSPRPKWFQNSVTSTNGRKRADSLRSNGSSPQDHSHRSTPSPIPPSRPSQIPVRTPNKSAARDMSTIRRPVTNSNHLRTDRDESQDRTPTIRTVQPPVEEDVRSTSPNSEPFDRLMSDAVSASKHQESPSRKSQANEPTPFLQSPPRLSATSNSNFDFQSPSPPKGLPELPGPPSMSEEEEESDFNYTSIAWERSLTAQGTTPEFENLTTMKTPRPPGAWLVTPAQPERVADTTPQEPPMSFHEPEYGGGLATPIASLSRATGLPTPVPPGAWVPTPAATPRKSILRVRFEPPPSKPTESSISMPTDDLGLSEYAIQRAQTPPSPNTTVDKLMGLSPEDTGRTPRAPVPRPKSPKSPRKSPKIRMRDAFGREAPSPVDCEHDQVNTFIASTPRSKNLVRIVDAMGREIVADAKESPNGDPAPESSLPSPPLDRREALARVRQGLSNLAQGIDEIDRATISKVDGSRMQELEELSRKARAKREELATRLYTAEPDLQTKVQNIRANKSMFATARRASWIPTGSWPWLVLIQAILLLFMYHFGTKRARDIFLSTYYDPFYPDLHLYTIRPDTLHHRIAPSRTSWISILETLQHHGWGATLKVIRDTMSIYIYDLRTRIWETWGEDTAKQVTSWPPT